VLTRVDLLDLEWQLHCFAGTNSARLNFNFTQYSTKSEIVDAISNLPKIIGSGNDVASAELMLKNSLFVDCPLRNNSLCVALILYDNAADSSVAVNTAAQVNVDKTVINILLVQTKINITPRSQHSTRLNCFFLGRVD
jgi:hypothetical protein